MNTDALYRKCLRTKGHRYGTETVVRDYMGHRVELRTCQRCGVPESPRLKTASVGAQKPRVTSTYWD